MKKGFPIIGWAVLSAGLFFLTGCMDLLHRPPGAADMVDDPVGSQAEMNIQNQHNAAARLLKPKDDVPFMKRPPRAGSGINHEMKLSAPLSSGEDGKSATETPEAVTLDFTDTSLKAVIESLLGDYLKVPFTFAEDFKDKNVNLSLHATATKEQILSLLQSFLESQGVRLKYAEGIYLVSSGEKIQKLMPSPEGIGDVTGLFRLRYMESKDFATIAKQVLSSPEKAVILSSYNALVVIGPANEVKAVNRLADQLDIPFFVGKHVIIYTPRYLTAKGLAAMLEQFQDQLGSTLSKPNRQFEIKEVLDTDRVIIVTANSEARDMIVEFINSTDTADKNRRQVFQYSLGSQKSPELITSISSLLKQVMKDAQDVTPVADKESNSILFVATPDEYAEIRKLVARLDQRPMSVLISITVAEVILNDALQYGVEWFLKNTGSLLTDIAGNMALPGLTKGLTWSLVSSGRDDSFITLNALKTVSDFNILSNPQMIVRNGGKASIEVGGEEPVVKTKLTTSTQQGGTNLPQTEFSTVKTGLQLEASPMINSNGDVKLAIKLSDIRISGDKTFPDGNTQPQLTNRKLETELVVEDGRTVFLGGIRQKSKGTTSSQIPPFAEIPYIGWLFKNNDQKTQGTEMIVLITPHVIMDQQGAELITQAILNASSTQEHQGFGDSAPSDQAPAQESIAIPSPIRVPDAPVSD